MTKSSPAQASGNAQDGGKPVPEKKTGDLGKNMNPAESMASARNEGGTQENKITKDGDKEDGRRKGASGRKTEKRGTSSSDRSKLSKEKEKGTVVVEGLSDGDDDGNTDSTEDSDEENDEPGNLLLKGARILCSPKFIIPNGKIGIEKASSTPKRAADPFDEILGKSPARGSPEKEEEEPPTSMKCMLAKWASFILFMFFCTGAGCLLFGRYSTKPVHCVVSVGRWQKIVMYEIFPASFQDSDGDGIGDIRGIIKRLDYLKNLGVDIIRLNSVYKAVDYPVEFERIVDFGDLDPRLGTMQDFKKLTFEAHRRRIRVILDFNPTMTSEEHRWALSWRRQTGERFDYYYVNLTEQERKSLADLYQEDGLESYSPYFDGNLMLNFSNEDVRRDILAVMDFWLRKGVDGFRMKHLGNIMFKEAMDLKIATHMWRGILDRHSVNTTRKMLIGSIEAAMALQQLFGPSHPITSLFDVIEVEIEFSPNRTLEVSDQVWSARKWASAYPSEPWLSWNFGDMDSSRLASRVGRKNTINCMFILTLLPGSLNIFYGDEIGIEDVFVNTGNTAYVPQFSPMSWNSSAGLGFTGDSTKIWMPADTAVSVASEETELALFKKLMAFKKTTYPYVFGKKAAGIQLTTPKYDGSFPMHEPNYRWYHDAEKSLLSVEVSYGPSQKFILFCNYGTEELGMSSLGTRGGEVYMWDDVTLDGMEIVVSSDDGAKRVRDVVLGPGQSVLCLFRA